MSYGNATGVKQGERCSLCGYRTIEFTLWGGRYQACGTCERVDQLNCQHQQEAPCQKQSPSS